MMDKARHQWAATGVSGYPLTHPIVGQGGFCEGFRHFIHLVDNEAEQFAHVYAVIAQWGVGKSRLGYELIAQINGSSRGWWVRDADGQLVQAQLFRDDADRDQYLGLYIRYSQVANDYNNVDNWFAFGLYKALLPLARESFDGSIQGQIAREASDRLMVAGFDPARLAAALEVSAGHSDETLYEDPVLATRLCQAAYDVLHQLGIKYVMVVLDELETAAEAATFGLDATDIKHLDGRAIKLMGKAIKEEDPRRKLPWLRYVALCSPAIGDELREIQSTARRFELAELQSNAFADVSDFVQILERDGRLAQSYPRGLVEAAYAMSGGNFGWFNVIMAGIDERLRDKRLRGEQDAPSLGALFDELVRVSGRVRQHVLDHNALEMLRLPDRAEQQAARELLYGQLPVPLQTWPAPTRAALLAARNEYDEPVATRLRRVEWDELEAAEALRNSKFTRDRGLWRLGGVDQPLDLRQLLSNLGTYAIHETGGQRRAGGKHTLVVPLRQADFVHLVALLYPHPAADDAARALWRRFLDEEELPPETATHIGPSIEMIERLNLRHRRQGQAALIFRDPDQNAAHEKLLSRLRTQPERERARQVLVGAMRVIDQHWAYDAASPGLREDGITVIATAPRSRGAPGGGLVAFDALKLHPKGRALFAWVKNEEELRRLCNAVKSQFTEEGRTPVVAFTASRALLDIMASPADGVLQAAKSYLMLYQLTSAEEHVLHQVGMPLQACDGFQLDGHGFTTAFNTRLQSLVRQFAGAVGEFRRGLDAQGRIAWPLRSTGRLKESEQALLLRVWQWLAIDQPQPASLADLDERAGIDLEEFKTLLARLGVSPKARAAGYLDGERAGLFSRLDDSAQAQFPPFLAQAIRNAFVGTWTFARAEHEWFWGYAWEGAKPRDTYGEWMALLRALGFARVPADAKSPDVHAPRTRAELRSAVQEADNWLRISYPKLVANMEQVFGSGRVLQLFAPLGSDAPGTKTLEASRRLQECLIDLDALDMAEAGKEPAAQTLRESAQRRRRVLGHVQWVYCRDQFQALQEDPNVKTLDFENDGAELWRRIRRASLFVGFVRRSEQHIRQRAASLADEMRIEAAALPGFPGSLFTLSLEKIEHILDGALDKAPAPGATALLQVTEPGSLRQHLRDLRVAEATQQLEMLAAEVGVELATGAQRPLEQIEGPIAAAYRELKGRYGKLRKDLDDTQARLRALEAVLSPSMPTDFAYPGEVPLPNRLRSRLGLIEESLESARAEEVDRLRSEFDAPARLGRFQPLMTQARGLLEEPSRSLGLLLGQVLSAENAVNAYRERLAGDPALARTQRGLDAIAAATGKEAPKALRAAELQAAGPLVEAQARVKLQMHRNEELGGQALAGTGVSFDRWCAVVEALDAGRDPLLQPHEAQALVDCGLVQRTYRLGGRA